MVLAFVQGHVGLRVHAYLWMRSSFTLPAVLESEAIVAGRQYWVDEAMGL